MGKKYLTIAEMIKVLGKYKLKARMTISRFCEKGLIPARRNPVPEGARPTASHWEVDGGYVGKAMEERAQCMVAWDLFPIAEKRHAGTLSPKALRQCMRKVAGMLGEYEFQNEYLIPFSGRLIRKEDVPKVMGMMEECIREYAMRESLLPLKEAAALAGWSAYILKEEIKKGNVKASLISGQYFLEPDEVKRVTKLGEGFVSTYKLAKEAAKDMSSAFDPEKEDDRAALNAFLLDTKAAPWLVRWDELNLHESRRNSFYVREEKMEEVLLIIRQYLCDFGMTKERMDAYLKSPYWETRERTKTAVMEYARTVSSGHAAAIMELLIGSECPEIMDCSNEDVKCLEALARKKEKKVYSVSLVRFTRFVQRHYSCAFNIRLIYSKSKAKNCVNNKPYSRREYLCGAHMVFSDEFIRKQGLVEKALDNHKYAIMWLHMAWQYTGAWRNSDFYGMALVPLPWDDREALRRIRGGKYEGMDEVALLLEASIISRQTRMHKTADKQDTNYLVVAFPESMRPVIGLVYAICYLGSDRKAFREPHFSPNDYASFFGEDYPRIFGRKQFSNRRANKAFLDFVAELVEKDSGMSKKAAGYMIAQYVRGHVSREWELSGTTSKYLSTKMDGMTADEVMMQLWETGACSFAVGMLLEAVYGERFSRLSVEYQTKAIKLSGLSPLSAEVAAGMALKAYERARNGVDIIFQRFASETAKEDASKKAILSIIRRDAFCKHSGISCLLSSMRLPCACVESKDGFGCPYAIYERSYLFLAVGKLKKAARHYAGAKTDGERKKIRSLIEEVYLPAIYEIMYFSKETYKMDISAYKQEVISLLQEVKYVGVG